MASRSRRGSCRRIVPASISASKKADARRTNGSSAAVIWVAAGGPNRETSRSRPSSSGWRAARRKTERTTASTRTQPAPAPRSAVSRASDRSAALRAITASSTASFDGNQYRMLCFVRSRFLASASSEVPS